MSSTQLADQESQSRSDTLGGAELSKEKSGDEVSDPQANDSQNLSQLRKYIVLGVTCTAVCFDMFTSNAVIVSLPSLGAALHFTPAALQWVLSAYTLTFSSFLLISGSLSDIFHPKPVFCMGFAIVGLFSIPVATSVHPIMTIVFRAIQGIGAAMNVPSSVAMIRTTFPDPVEQSKAYAVYALCGAMGGVVGFVIGGVLTARTSWRWVHYFVALVVIPTSIASWFLLPKHKVPPTSQRRALDFAGVLTLTAGLILFVYAISDGSEAGWGSPQVITTLVLSVVVCTAFFFIERFVKNPALPPKTWTNKNFLPLFFYAWSPYWWCLSCELQLVNVFTILWHDTALIAAVRCIPMGVAGAFTAYFAGKYVPKMPPKVVLVGCQVLMAVGSVLFALADTRDKYWPYIFPGMVVGNIGLVAGYVACTTMVMNCARKGEEGVVGAVMYTAYQLGSTLGFVIVTSISEGINRGRPDDPISQFQGYAASFWSMVGMPGALIIIVLLFVRK